LPGDKEETMSKRENDWMDETDIACIENLPPLVIPERKSDGPVSFGTAKQLLNILWSIPRDAKKPNLISEPGGDVALYWETDNGKLRVSLGADARLGYGWIIYLKDEPYRHEEDIDAVDFDGKSFPVEILKVLRRL